MTERDAKIPDHEKLPKDCIYYKHFLQVQMNKKIEKAARTQIKEDRDMLRKIGADMSPDKKDKDASRELDPDDAKGNKLVRKKKK